MNVERMRHQLRRTGDAADEAAQLRRLARMTPEHRVRHERAVRLGGLCFECIDDAIRQSADRRRQALGRLQVELATMSQRAKARG